MKKWLADKWFILGLVAVAVITTADSSEWTVRLGRLLKNHHGTDIVIVLIFFFSGWVLDANQIKTGLVDAKASLTALVTIFHLPKVLYGTPGLVNKFTYVLIYVCAESLLKVKKLNLLHIFFAHPE